MILPTKHIDLQHSFLGAGATLLQHLQSPRTVTGLWDRVRANSEINVYQRFILVLDFLFAIGAIDYVDGLIIRRNP
uniref:Uncharacterized protein n=1 Tax=Candidatus Kentrum sp. DK TaxID=2126562 RepID=A0A450T9P4_9GAMM|nr:MAG: hypothetical protein BECKDK2373B_GA0170837_103424 [Candidatus Kentron sp. DK]VFJ63402.1 MAG: hypothetical protein BECKDK2373C_GA0170839_11078 [Candidatus Kentron sp. DK]